jgi:hypothetical protein
MTTLTKKIVCDDRCLTSSTSSGVIINGGESIMLSPATLMSIPRFSHSAPKIEPTPEINTELKLDYLIQQKIITFPPERVAFEEQFGW